MIEQSFKNIEYELWVAGKRKATSRWIDEVYQEWCSLNEDKTPSIRVVYSNYDTKEVSKWIDARFVREGDNGETIYWVA